MAREFIHDHLQQIWAGVETVLGGGTAIPLATDALDHISIDTPLMAKRVIPNADQTGNRGAKSPGRGAYDPVAVNVLLHLKGGGSATTPPDFDCLLRASGFTETIGSSVVYARALEPTESAWIWVATRDGSEGKMYAGFIPGEISLPDVGVDFNKIQFAGNASHVSAVYKTTVGTGGITALATTLPLHASHGWVIGGAPAFIKVAEGANTEIMRVTACSGTSATVTRKADGLTSYAFTTAAVITAYFPARTVAATKPIGETLGSLTINDGGGAVGRKMVKAGITIRTGVDHLAKEAFSENRDGLAAMRYGDDAVRQTVDFVYSVGADGVAYLHRHRNEETDLAVVTTIGTTIGNRCIITLPTAQVVDIDAPNAGDGPRAGTVIFGGYSTNGADIKIEFN